MKDLNKWCLQENITSPNEFEKRLRSEDETAQELFTALYSRMWKQNLAAACEYVRMLNPVYDYKEQLERIELDLGDKEVHAVLKWYAYIFNLQGLKQADINKMFDIMLDKLGKQNTLYLQGKASAGKSAIMNLFTSLYPEHNIGSVVPDKEHGRFTFSTLVNKMVYCLTRS